MPPDLSAILWTLPGPRQYIRKMSQDIKNGVSQIIFSPRSMSAYSFRESLLESLEKDLYLRAYPLDLSSSGESVPIEILKAHFPCLSDSLYLEKAVESDDLPDVILLENSGSSLTRIQDWINAIDRWAEACRSSGAKHSLILILESVNPAELKLPPKDIRLNYRVLAGFPSSLEVRLLCRMAADEIDAENQWREYILASLAGNDLSLIALLWDEVFNPVESIIKTLRIYGENNSWKTNRNGNSRNWRPKPPGLELSPRPDEPSFELLSSGRTIYTSEYGEETHPVLLAVDKKEQEIIHRLWRSQAALLLPTVDDIRRRVCNYFCATQGENWAFIDQELLPSPVELGKLKIYFDKLPDSSWEKRQWGNGINQTWKIRNDLAHYTPISYSAFYELWRLNNNVRSKSSQY